jgi:hypothetical protein
MDDIYLKRENNLSDITDVEAARNNLSIIDGRESTPAVVGRCGHTTLLCP